MLICNGDRGVDDASDDRPGSADVGTGGPQEVKHLERIDAPGLA